MNTGNIIEEIKKKYPGKTIILDPEEDPTEIICEIDPTADHAERSIALAVVGKSKSHVHKKSTEVYEAIKGQLIVYTNGKKFMLQEGEKMTIKPGEVHYAEGNEAWFLTYSEPGWRLDDHIVNFKAKP
ncbi:hypothetical protein A2875_04525 [Candidatus Gottesmanbacteria bacterium RIFCSPHIGHO2_01_FULL_46_14]|uniref:AraC-type arabinose-binding/dimerisation domain-containing protein n=2 Tax=Candidatus Gottesmaniibacteriota TaxID=1752720 RepID=A0A1F5ZJ62_9BACT|nr:MAG: hypothetical protein A2875_04525 [Candidatus Gottesmanbacteria bacterium RIFCSPHIGHO2_01_FULL_46_14]OGG29628.1 MAG: hypothetical protein A2971_01150 [Candidatus Gottesmanbacteria bacterium RIFCSPLOWO2_01_FULL_46_21]